MSFLCIKPFSIGKQGTQYHHRLQPLWRIKTVCFLSFLASLLVIIVSLCGISPLSKGVSEGGEGGRMFWFDRVQAVDLCSVFDAKGVVITLVTKEKLDTYVQRFDYLLPPAESESDLSLVAIYGEGQTLPRYVNSSLGGKRMIAVRVAAENGYPPQQLEYKAMELVSECTAKQPKLQFVLRLDLDAFVAPSYLDELLLLFSNSSHDRLLIGRPGIGRPHAVGKLGFPRGTAYCMGGTSVAYGRGLLEAMDQEKWRDCAMHPFSFHSDTEIQRCLYEHTGASCSNPGSFRLHQLASKHFPNRDHGQLLIDADSWLTKMHVVHPLKDGMEFQSVRDATLLRLVPPVNQRQILYNGGTSELAEKYCCLNRFAQKQYSSCGGGFDGDKCSLPIPRCPLPEKMALSSDIRTIYMISMQGEASEMRRKKTWNRFKYVNMTNVVVIATPEEERKELHRVAEWARGEGYLAKGDQDDTHALRPNETDLLQSIEDPRTFPLPGEVNLIASTRKALDLALASGEEYFIIIDDDAVPLLQFEKELRHLMEEGCGRYMQQYAGILRLGASEGGYRWKVIDQSIYHSCYDAHDQTYGSFATLYNRHGAMIVLQELEKRPNIPFDHLFYLAALRGAFVSVALPNLAMVDHWRKTSSVDPKRGTDGGDMKHRIRVNRWNQARYRWRPEGFVSNFYTKQMEGGDEKEDGQIL